MFTGIVEEIGKIISSSGGSLTIGARKVLTEAALGDSIAVNGVCLTVTALNDTSFSADVMEETLSKTTLGRLRLGDSVNLESALTLSKGIGGHLVEGHVDATGRIISISPLGQSRIIRIGAPPEVMRYVVTKGFIAINGISLTVVEHDEHSFTVSIVKFTMDNTILGEARAGDAVNLEADIIAKYVERCIGKKGGLTEDFLKEHGFIKS
ncbi:MAG: riboflavin synthase [Dehalococcoidia bacterium]|nr:riboflavin synthase [Dehalococcoidia bacterium]